MTYMIRLKLLLVFVLITVAVAAYGGSGATTDVAPTTTPLPTQADLAPPGATLGDEQVDEDIHAWLSSTPAQPTKGTAKIDAYLVADDGQPIEDAQVTFDIDMTNMSHGHYQVATESAGEGHYAGNVNFSMPGPWRITATVERPGHEAVQLRFEFRVNSG